MKKYLIVFLIIGIACGQEEKDMIILKNGNRYYGDYVGDLNEFVIIFKPIDSLEKQYINRNIISDLKLRDGTYAIGGDYMFGGNTKSEVVKKNNLYISNNIRPQWNFHNPKDPFKAGILSLLLPSGGHIYNEEYSKAIFYLIGVPIIYVVGGLITANNKDKNDDSGIAFGGIIQISALFLHFYNSYDAILSSHKINKEYFKEYIKNENISK